MKTEEKMGYILLIVSSCLYTFERFLSVLIWSSETVPVKLSGSGQYPINPTMPGVFDNIFIPMLFIIGLLLIILSFRNKIKEKK